MKVLINAYACSPGMGSEPGMAWNWCVNLAKYCELIIITEGEFSERIEEAMQTLPQSTNMHFYYNPVSEKIRQMCWNQGDWRFYKYYREWQWKTYLMAKDICRWDHVDILHQLNMIGFREPGYLWKLSREMDIPFVWGPIGGLKLFPIGFMTHANMKQRIFNKLKNSITLWQLKHDKRVNSALHTASILISAIPDSQSAIKQYKGLDSIIIPETGCTPNKDEVSNRGNKERLDLLWVGKFDYRKQLELAIETLAKVANGLSLSANKIRLVVCGTGNSEQIARYHRMTEILNVSKHVVWKGQCKHEEVLKEMQEADLLFFTSVNDDTSTVVLEAISNALPVLCHNAMGFGYVINEKCGIKIPLANPQQSAKDFAEKIMYLYQHRDELQRLSDGCKAVSEKFSWDNKAKEMVEQYKKVLTSRSHR